MIHGWPLSSDTFDDLGMAVANAGVRAIAYDRRGFGRSDQPWDGYEYETLTDDLDAVLDQCDARDAVLVGFSMGGGEVARYLSRYPDNRISGAVLIGSVVPCMLQTPDNPDGVDQATFDSMRDGMEQDRAAFWTTFFHQFYGMGLCDAAGQQRGRGLVAEHRHASQPQSHARLRAGLRDDGLSRRPGLVCVPTLIIHGTADKTVPIDATTRKAAAAIVDSTLTEYDGRRMACWRRTSRGSSRMCCSS